jgi:enoyl-CoA hydratase/carnithine racemase
MSEKESRGYKHQADICYAAVTPLLAVTFDHPPLNIFGPETIPQLNEIVTAFETEKHVKVVVFDSAVEGFFLTHYDFLAKLEETTILPRGPTGLQLLPDMLVCLSRAPIVSIVSIRGAGPVSEVSLPWPATCVSRAAKKAIMTGRSSEAANHG